MRKGIWLICNIKKPDGFTGEKTTVLPRDFLNDASSQPLCKLLYPTDVGFYPNALHHYRERPDGCTQYILIYCVGGAGFATFGGRRHILQEGKILVIPAGTPHTYGSDDQKPWSIYWIHFDGINSSCYLSDINADNPVITIPIDKTPRIRLLFDDIIETLETGYTFTNFIYVSQMLCGLLGLIFFSSQSFQSSGTSTPIEQSIDYMLKHLDKKATLVSLAAQSNLSATQYGYLFKKKTGFSPINYFMRLKIHRACQLLDTTDFTVCDIAKRLGFNDPYYFSRAFCKIMRYSPTAYRKIKKG